MKLYNWPTRTRLLLNGGVRDKNGVGSFWELLTHILLPTCCVVWMPWVCACGRWGEVRDVCSVGSPTHFPVLLWPNSRHSPLESSRGSWCDLWGNYLKKLLPRAWKRPAGAEEAPLTGHSAPRWGESHGRLYSMVVGSYSIFGLESICQGRDCFLSTRNLDISWDICLL